MVVICSVDDMGVLVMQANFAFTDPKMNIKLPPGRYNKRHTHLDEVQVGFKELT